MSPSILVLEVAYTMDCQVPFRLPFVKKQLLVPSSYTNHQQTPSALSLIEGDKLFANGVRGINAYSAGLSPEGFDD